MSRLKLKESDLLRQQALFAGRWQDAHEGATLPVTDPATGETLATIPALGRAEAEQAIAFAETVRISWGKTTNASCAALLEKWHQLIDEHADDLAIIMTAEQGKPLAEARGEVLYDASFVKWFAEEARRIYGDTIPAPSEDRRILVLKQPVGVAAAITPWNFPIAMITRKVAPALAAGCPIIVKPSELTPLSALALALALAVLAERAGFPSGVLQVLTGLPAEIGAALTESRTVRKISFTGSTRIGQLLMQQSANSIKRLSLELGGNAPLFIFDDEEEAIAMANDTPYGLGAYFFTENIRRAWRVAEALEFGMVGFNTGAISLEVAPW